jgi:hypothetical protein
MDIDEGEEIELVGDGDAIDTDDEGAGELADEMVHDEIDGGDEDDESAADLTPSGPDTSIARFTGHSDSVVCLAVSPDGLLACTGSVDDTAAIWRTRDGTLIASLAHVETVAAVAFSASGKLLATGSFDGVVRVWLVPSADAAPADSSTPVATLDGPGGDILFLAWHPLGDVLLAGSTDSTVWMWSVGEKSSSCMQVFAAGEGDAAAGAFTHDGKKVLVGSGDGSLRVFSPKTGACEHAFSGRTWDAPITTIWQSGLDPALVAVASMDGVVRVVNLAAKKVVLSVDHNEADEGAVLPGDAEGDESTTSAEWCVPRERRLSRPVLPILPVPVPLHNPKQQCRFLQGAAVVRFWRHEWRAYDFGCC